jgi:ubiquinone/menaquinone biosynthesis C-methylase UbiE
MLSTNIATSISKRLMQAFQTFPVPPTEKINDFQEVLYHDIFINGTPETRQNILLQSSLTSYESEVTHPWDSYFDVDLKPYLQGKDVLDLGCFNGGRGLAWYERYEFASITGVDIYPEYMDAANQFAQFRHANAKYVLSEGAGLPFADNSFDAIVSYEVFEHLPDAALMLRECHRVLKPSGVMCVVFPSYYQPVGHHLYLVTRLPMIHWFFSGQTLVNAYYQILQERGEEAYWYQRESPQLATWEKGNTINGTTLGLFRRYIQQRPWQVLLDQRKPVGMAGWRVKTDARAKLIATLLSPILRPLLYVPGLQELFLHRITFILQKQS